MTPKRRDEESVLVAAAAAGSHEAFGALVEPLDRELHLFCYRMLGSFHDAEDVLQEARVKAWRGLARFDHRSSFRSWMYRVVTNATLDALRARRRRVLPQDLGAARDPALGLGDPRHDVPWLEPYPDALLPDADPHAALELRESVRLAFVRALQVLPPRQRAVLILREVLDWSAAEVASAIDATVAAVNGALQRARATMAAQRSAPGVEPAGGLEPARAAMAARYVLAWEAGDLDAVVAMLTEDATHAMPPWAAWFSGRRALRTVYAAYPIWEGRPGPGVFRIVPTALNGELAFAEYCREGRSGPYHGLAFTLVALDRVGTHITGKTSFVDAGLFDAMGLPAVLD